MTMSRIRAACAGLSAIAAFGSLAMLPRAQGQSQKGQGARPVITGAGMEVQLRGDRFPGLKYRDMTDEQKALTDRAAEGKGAVGTFNIMLRSPGFVEAVRGASGFRTMSELPPKLSELAILTTARYWTTQFEWMVHRKAAEDAGLKKDIIDEIRLGRQPKTLPESMSKEERAVYEFLRELYTNKQVNDNTFQAIRTAIGDKAIVDTIAIAGYYQLSSMLMDVDRYPMANPEQIAELPILAKPLPVPRMQPPIEGAEVFNTAEGTEVKSEGPNGVTMDLRGNRFKPLAYSELDAKQKAFADRVLTGEIPGGTGGPFNVLLRSPGLGEGIVRYGAYMRFQSPVPEKLRELAILVACRDWTAQFPWYAHRRAAEMAGLNPSVAKAIAEGRRPTGLAADEAAVYEFARELMKTKQVSDRTFAAAKATLGEQGVVELIGQLGYYGIVAMVVNTDRYPMPMGVAPELKWLAEPLP